MPEHAVRIRETKIGNALIDMAEDGIAEAISHACNPLTEEKSSVITLKVTITPNENRDQFATTVSHAMRLAPTQTVGVTLFGGVGPGGVEAVEYNPRQLAMFTPAVTQGEGE